MTPRCTNSLGKRGPCGEVLRVETNDLGAVRYRCIRCEARAKGRCWNCGKPRDNDLKRGVFCKPCGFASYRIAQIRSESSPERQKVRREYDRKRWKDPEARAKKLEARRRWLESRPEKVREYKFKDKLRHALGA